MKKRKVKIRESSWLARLAAWKLGFDYVAMVFGRTIHLHNTTVETFLKRPSWVVHELKHVEQYDRMGLLGFLWHYLVEYIRHGYWKNGLEVEARNAEGDFTLLHQYDLSPYEVPQPVSA